MKFSRQREAILSFLQSRRDHPTAELVYSNVKDTFPNISLGTVYRNLNQLAEAGIITKHSFGGLSIDHFDYNTVPHQHFVCTRCNAVLDLAMKDVDFSFIDKTLLQWLRFRFLTPFVFLRQDFHLHVHRFRCIRTGRFSLCPYRLLWNS